MYKNYTRIVKYSILLALSFFSKEICSSVILSAVNKLSLTVGERLNFQVTTIVPKGAIVTPPSLDTSLGNIVVKGWNTHKSETENTDSITFSYVITTYVPERCTIPTFSYVVQDKQKADTLRTHAIPLEVQSVIPAETVDIKDLKPQQISGHAPLWWVWIIAIIFSVLTGIIIYKRFFSKKSTPVSIVPLLPPYEEAIAALNELERKKYLLRGLIREYVFDLSEILKRYIERRFTINASEFTTEEIIAWLGVSGLDSKIKQSVEWFFKTSDPIKFAKHIPDDLTINRFLSVTTDFLNATRPVLEGSPTAKANNPIAGNVSSGTVSEQINKTSPAGEKR